MRVGAFIAVASVARMSEAISGIDRRARDLAFRFASCGLRTPSALMVKRREAPSRTIEAAPSFETPAFAKLRWAPQDEAERGFAAPAGKLQSCDILAS